MYVLINHVIYNQMVVSTKVPIPTFYILFNIILYL